MVKISFNCNFINADKPMLYRFERTNQRNFMRIRRSHILSLSLISCLFAILCTSCLMGFVWMVDYVYTTSAVRVVSDTETVLVTKNKGSKVDLITSDHIVQFSFHVDVGSILVSIRNQQSQAMHLDLENSYYVDPDGNIHQLFVYEPSNLIDPGSTLQLSVWPEDWMRKGLDGPTTWKGDSPLGGSTINEGTRKDALTARKQDIGRSFEIVLPVLIGDDQYSYRFRFTVEKLRARRTLWA